MNRKAHIQSAAILCLASTLAACSRSDNDIGTIFYDSGATGGASGSVTTSGGSGGTGGAGGTTTPVGTGGSSGSGGSGGNASDASEPGTCAPCVDESIGGLAGCPTQRPTTKDDLSALCGSLAMARLTTVTLTFGDCVVVERPAECSTMAPDPDVQALYVGGLGGTSFTCHYSRVTGALLGSVAFTDFTHYCNGRSPVAATSGVKNQWCTANGQTAISVTCPAPPADGGIDGPASDSAIDLAPGSDVGGSDSSGPDSVDASTGSNILDLFPRNYTIAGWTVDPSNSPTVGLIAATATTLSDAENLIDGAASDFFAGPNVPVIFAWQNYVSTTVPTASPPDGAKVMLYILQMASAQQAAGLYASLRSAALYARTTWSEPTSPLVGTNSRIQDTGDHGWINFYKNNYYVEISLSPSYGPAPNYTPGNASTKTAAIQFAQAIASVM